MQRKLLGIINTDFDVTGRLLITYYAIVKYFRKYGNTIRQCSSYLQTSRKPMIQLRVGYCIKLKLSLASPETSKGEKKVSK